MEINLPHLWRPRPYQEAAWRAFEQGVKRFALVWHRRAGKDDFALRAASVAAHTRVGTYWHMLPEQTQARKAIWEAVDAHTGKRRVDAAFPNEICKKRDTDMSIKFNNGSTWQVVGSDNYDSLMGAGVAGVVFSEWPLAKPEAWAFIRPMLAENNGWAMFLYTPRGPNHGMRTYHLATRSPNWFGQLLTADDTITGYTEDGEPTYVFSKQQLALEKEELISDYGEDMGLSLYEQEFFCSFEAAVVGSIYGAQITRARTEGRITPVIHDPQYPVGTTWDLGYTDSTAIWFFQLIGSQVRFIDYYEASNVPLDHFVDVLHEKKKSRGFKYSSQHMYFPHDVEQHESISGITRRHALWKMGVTATVVPKSAVWDGVEAVRRQFKRFWFDTDHCEKGIEHLTMYQRKWDMKNRVFMPNPDHNEHSHGADALRTCAQMLPEVSRDVIVGNHKSDYGRRSSEPVPSAPSQWSM